MLTARGWWFLVAVSLLTLVGVTGAARYSAAVPLVGLTLLAWFATEWVLFAYRFRATAAGLVVTRELRQGGRPVPAVWAGVECTVRVAVRSTGSGRLPFVHLEDRLPAEIVARGGANARSTHLEAGGVAEVEYALKTDALGVLRFEGVHVRVADLAGLFYRRVFLRRPVDVLVLPPLAAGRTRRHGMKRFNTLPPPGVHRLRAPGGGSELLDLRDYRPGDPPKTIAWKPSARRDKLITKELESDVPVRCVLFVDASTGARVGPPGQAPVARLAAVAAAVAQAAVGSRDLVGVTVFDEAGTTDLKPARTAVHTVALLRALAEAAARLPDPGQTDPDLLARYAFPVAAELYPDLLAADVNSRPFGLFWLPVGDTRWAWVQRPLLYGPLVVAVAAAALLVKPLQPYAVAGFDALARVGLAVARGPGAVLVPAAMIGLLAAAAALFGLVHGARGLFPPRAPRTSRRKQLGALFAGLDGDGPAAIERHRHDDGFFAARAARFLLDHRVRLPLVLTDAAGRNRFRSEGEGKVAVLADALTRAVGRARDNELYVILADLAELGPDLDPLVRAAQVARARHHQVLVIVPWPADVPVDANAASTSSTRPLRIGGLIQSVLVGRYHAGYVAVRTALARVGATVVRAEADDQVRLVLDRLDRLRGARGRR